MIYIFCGEDSVSARSAFTDTLNKYRASQAEIVSIQPSSILEIQKGLSENLSLFSSQIVYVVEGLEKYGFKKSTKSKRDEVYEAIQEISLNKAIILIDFEDGKQSRQLKLKDLAHVNESKPSTSIFKLLDECIPSNKQKFIQSLRSVCSSQDEMFVFVMLFRHIRQLVLALDDSLSPKLPPWQKFKISGQAKKWKKQILTDFYSGLIKIEISSKTSLNPYGIQKSLEILACHYL